MKCKERTWSIGVGVVCVLWKFILFLIFQGATAVLDVLCNHKCTLILQRTIYTHIFTYTYTYINMCTYTYKYVSYEFMRQ
jgi:hypothetical protein